MKMTCFGWALLASLVGNCGLAADDAFVFISPQGEWKSTVEKDEHGASSFSGSFVNAKAVKSAVAEVTALGAFEFYVNGSLVSASADGDRADFLRPGFTDPWRRRVYLSYDVTGSWRKEAKAANDLGAFVATSWFSDGIAGRPDVKSAFAARVRVTYADGTADTFATGPDWKASFESPFVRAAIYGGEIFDARKAALPGTFAAAARAAEINTNFTGTVSPHEGAEVYLRRDLTRKPFAAWVYREVEGASGTNAYGRVKILRQYDSDRVKTFANGQEVVGKPCPDGVKMTLEKGETLVVDFGQNMAAVPEFVARAAAGTELTFKGGEMLNDANGERSRGNDGPAGSVYRANYRSLQGDAGALVRYVFAGKGAEKYLPTFTFLGFRYASITATGPVEIESLRAIPVTSIGRAMERGTLKTGNRDVNRLIANCRWGQYSNYLSVPTDCPQRDERLGWTADTQVFTAAAFRNADVYAFLSKWMTDMRDGQWNGTFPSVAPLSRWGDCGRNRLGWADAGVIVPWTCWKMTGDKTIVERNWEAMKAFVASQERNRYASTEEFQYGDWLAYEQVAGGYWDENGVTGEAIRFWDYLAGCYWYANAVRMREMAEALGRKDEVTAYVNLAKKARRYLKTYFFEDDGGLSRKFRHLQTPVLFALHLGLYDDDNARAEAIAALRKNFADHGDCLQTGFLGTSILMDAVTYGMGDARLAYTLLLQHKNPSWLYSVDQGATTIWERWNSYVKDTGFGDVGMNSFNHYAYGAVLDWMYGTMAGIRPGPKGGFDDAFVLAPIPDERLGSVEATYRTAKGVIRSAWKYEDGKCRWRFTVPAGSRATVKANGVEQEYGPGDHALELGPVAKTAVAVPALVPAPREMKLLPGTVPASAEVKYLEVKDGSIPEEGYRLTIRDGRIEVASASKAGRIYADATLRQWRDGDVYRCVEIVDSPRYRWRGVQMDECRHFFGKETVKRVMDLMVDHKLNVFHWHLTEDQGWRLDIPGYPELVRYGAVRSASPAHGKVVDQGDSIDTSRLNGEKYGPFYYTEADLREIVAYAAERNIRIVPEIELPGHFRAVLAAYPEFGCRPEAVTKREPLCGFGISSEVMCVGNDKAVKFLEDVLDYVCRVFPGEVIHIGGDECPQRNWKTCKKCQARIAAEKLGDEKGLQPWVTRHFVKFLEARGKRAIGWDEYLLGDVPKSAIGMDWRDGIRTGAGHEALTAADLAARGHEIVMCPVGRCYFDYSQVLPDDPYQYIGGWLPLYIAYDFNPCENVPEAQRGLVLGGQCNNWSEYTWNRYDLEWKMWPRTCALAEVLWTGEKKPGFKDFRRRMDMHRRRLVKAGVNCAPLE